MRSAAANSSNIRRWLGGITLTQKVFSWSAKPKKRHKTKIIKSSQAKENRRLELGANGNGDDDDDDDLPDDPDGGECDAR